MIIRYHGVNYHWSFKKFMVNLMIILLVISFWTVYNSKVAKATTDKKVIEMTVRRGDTLWSIAQRLAPETDPRIIIKQIKSQNNLNTVNLIAGQKLEMEIVSNR